ncbi:MAG TPA: PIN domain-containing protein [Patescibacteria group bacterium]
MKDGLIVILDSDGLIALINQEDANNRQAMQINNFFREQKATMIIPVTTIVEAITALKRKINKPELTKVIIDSCISGAIPVIDVPANILSEAVVFFKADGSKKDTMFDAVICAFAKRYKADAIFSFDKGYKKSNIPLAADLLKD